MSLELGSSGQWVADGDMLRRLHLPVTSVCQTSVPAVALHKEESMRPVGGKHVHIIISRSTIRFRTYLVSVHKRVWSIFY